MKNNFKFISVALTLVLCFAAAAFGQRTSGNIEGTITDPNGAVVPNATVTATATGSTAGFTRTTTADGNGYYQIGQVPPGTYSVTATASGFKSSKQNNVSVSIDQTSQAGFKLEVGGGEVVVDVSGDSATTIDPGDTKIDSNIGKKLYDDLPSGVTFASLLKVAPNVRPESKGAGFQIDGASGAENVFVIDGQEVTNFRTGQLDSNFNISMENVQEVQIKSTGYEAEYGGATGGVINVVTAGGNNQLRGNFGVSFKPGKWQGSRNPALSTFTTATAAANTPGNTTYLTLPNDGGVDFFPVGRLGGPIVKDKLWFAVAYAPQILGTTRNIDYYSNSIAGNNTFNPNGRFVTKSIEYSSQVKQEDVFIRLDAQPTSRLRFFGTFIWNPIIQDGVLPATTEGYGGAEQLVNFGGSIGTVSGADLLGRQGGRQNANAYNFQGTWTPTNNWIINGRTGRSYLNEKLNSYFLPRTTRYICSALGPLTPAQTGCNQGFQNIANNSQVNFDISTRTTYDIDASVVGVNFGGRHNLKFGYQLNKLFNNVDRGYRDLGIIQLFYDRNITALAGVAATPGNAGSGLMTRFGTVGKASSDNQALFVQDSWTIANRLTLNLGVRIEKEIVPNFGAAGSNAINFGWGDKISPRIGVAYAINSKTKIFGNFGQFYDRFKYELPRGSFGGDFFRRDFFEVFPVGTGHGTGLVYTNYTRANILGSFTDPIGGECPIAAPTGLSRCQFDFRIATNLEGADIFQTGAIDPNIKAARQTEYTFGVEREIGNNMIIAGRFTHKKVDRTVEDVGVFNDQGSEAYIIGNPGFGLVCEISSSANLPCPKANRDYKAFEVRLDKRASKYFYSANYTYSRLFGNYSGLASSDENGRSSPNVNRFFDLPPLGFTADGDPDDGLLATDRPHVFKAYGGYTFDWRSNGINSTTVSGFTTMQSGTPITTIYNLYSLGSTILNGRGDLGRTETFTETDLSIKHRYKFGRDTRYTVEAFVDFRNVFDERNVTDLQSNISSVNFTAATLSTAQAGCTTCGDEAAVFQTIFNGSGIRQNVLNYIGSPVTALGSRTLNTYGMANGFQFGRDVRFGFKFFF